MENPFKKEERVYVVNDLEFIVTPVVMGAYLKFNNLNDAKIEEVQEFNEFWVEESNKQKQAMEDLKTKGYEMTSPEWKEFTKTSRESTKEKRKQQFLLTENILTDLVHEIINYRRTVPITKEQINDLFWQDIKIDIINTYKKYNHLEEEVISPLDFLNTEENTKKVQGRLREIVEYKKSLEEAMELVSS